MHIYACIFSVSITPFNRRKITEGLMRELKKNYDPQGVRSDRNVQLHFKHN